jgi:hypothetical protein
MKYDAYSRPFRLPELAVKLVSVVQEWLRTRVKILEAECIRKTREILNLDLTRLLPNKYE